MTDRAERPWELLPGRSDPCNETRSMGRRPTAAGIAGAVGGAGMPNSISLINLKTIFYIN